MPRFRVLLVAALVLSAVPVVANAKPKDAGSQVRAGVGVVDATWNVGASAGQYATGRYGVEDAEPRPEDLLEGDYDPNHHQVKRTPSYGVESRLTVRAIVVEGSNGKRVALMKSDNYLAQDLISRRAAQILAERGSSITKDRILHAATHNHSSPYYTTPAYGVWIFQDAMDVRMFEYQATAMADAITKAENALVPVRMGATEVTFKGTFRNVPGPKVADDGSPTGYPKRYNDEGLVVVRFDDVREKKPKPLAVWMNYGVHPESLENHDLITADWVGPMERFVDRATGVPTVFSQGGVGSSEPNNEPDTILDHGVRSGFYHEGFAQAERHARLMADKVVEAFNLIGEGNAKVPFSTDFEVDMFDGWVPGPVSHPYPSVSNCRTEPTVEGNPGILIGEAPDCLRAQDSKNRDGQSMLFESLKMHGLPVPAGPPEHYDAPSFTAVQENMRIHLQVVKLGDVVLASCSCEAQVDLILNLESRLNDVEGDFYDGYDWAQHCEPNGDGRWKCANPEKHNLADRSLVISDAVYRRMYAQVHNDAAGWDAPEYAPFANAEPADPAQIKGNFTKEELSEDRGYKLAVGIGHAGDYNGYVVSYREYMSFDEYRKALTAWGPHTADYMNTRLVRMARYLNGGAHPGAEFLDGLAQADEARQEAEATAIGQAASAAYTAWNATLPDDKGPAGVITDAANVTRFQAATFTWRGGNNDVDQPAVRVERLREGKGKKSGWEPFADQTGEVQTVVAFPKGVQSQLTYRTNQQEWQWTANFEAADWFPRHISPEGQVPDGTYRFVVDGVIRQKGANTPYHLESKPFTVSPWTGVTVSDVRAEPAGSVSFAAAANYPRTYDAHDNVRFIGDDGRNPICRTCTFRPWASSGQVVAAVVTVVRADGTQQQVVATQQNGRWVAPTALGPGDRAFVAAGGVRDEFGETNGSASSEVRA